MASFNFTNLAKHLAKADIDFDTATMKVMLVSAVPSGANQDAWVFRSDVTNEVTGSGYTAGGIAQAFTLDALGANAQTVTYTSGVNWPTSTITAVGAIIYQNVGSAATDKLLHFVDFAGSVVSTGGTFTLNYSAPFTITA